ncbi:MAG: hypothetical protein HKO64_08335, partial [Xanthomonadales bacterium]|nr:hypothetical protein [Gammaproteobacteria bacterium]NNL95615.1 hypothetical protein [Xanthomonadales bacterium]
AAIAAVIGAIVVAAAFFLGFIVLLIVAGVGLIVWLGLVIRFKWLQRSLRKQGKEPWPSPENRQKGQSTGGSAIEGEFTVVSRDADD